MPLDLFESLSPHTRVATAVLPFVAAMLVRIFMGRCRFTGMLITVTTVWFAINILLAPYSARMRQDLTDLQYIFR